MTAPDAIVVPGGGSQRDTSPQSLPVWTRRRLDAAIDEFHRHAPHQPLIIVLSAGTPHRPNYITPHGWPVAEATSAALYILERDPTIPPQCVMREMVSLDTIGNCYFLRTIHTEIASLRRLLVITSAFHMPRTIATFFFVFRVCTTGGMQGRECPPYELSFREVSDEGLDVGHRVAKEAASLEAFYRTVREQFGVDMASLALHASSGAVNGEVATTVPLSELHRWLFTCHKAYATHGEIVPTADSNSLEPSILATY